VGVEPVDDGVAAEAGVEPLEVGVTPNDGLTAPEPIAIGALVD